MFSLICFFLCVFCLQGLSHHPHPFNPAGLFFPCLVSKQPDQSLLAHTRDLPGIGKYLQHPLRWIKYKFVLKYKETHNEQSIGQSYHHKQFYKESRANSLHTFLPITERLQFEFPLCDLQCFLVHPLLNPSANAPAVSCSLRTTSSLTLHLCLKESWKGLNPFTILTWLKKMSNKIHISNHNGFSSLLWQETSLSPALKKPRSYGTDRIVENMILSIHKKHKVISIS